MRKPIHANIDADILRYQLGSILSKGDTITIGKFTVNVPQSKAAVIKLVKDKIQKIMDDTKTKTCTCFLSEGKNFRFDRASIQPYKGNRSGFIKPYHYKTISEVIHKMYDTVVCTDFEADDILCAKQDVLNGTTVLCSRDKDLRTKEGWHYSWSAGVHNPVKSLYWISKIDGLRWFYTQCLTGDSTDNILGCGIKLPTKAGKLRRNGIGKKKAQTLLLHTTTEEEMFTIVAGQYKYIYGEKWKETFIENGTLLWMCDTLVPWEDLANTKRMFKEL